MISSGEFSFSSSVDSSGVEAGAWDESDSVLAPGISSLGKPLDALLILAWVLSSVVVHNLMVFLLGLGEPDEVEGFLFFGATERVVVLDLDSELVVDIAEPEVAEAIVVAVECPAAGLPVWSGILFLIWSCGGVYGEPILLPCLRT